MVIVLLAACSTTVEPTLIELQDENNYSFEGDLSVPVLSTTSGSDITLDWSALASDLQCHDLDPAADIDNVGLVRFKNKTQAEVELGMEKDTLQQADVDGYAEYNVNDVTSTQLSNVSFFGTPIDLGTEYVEGGGTYLMLLTTGTETGVGARMVSFLDPHADSDVTTAAVPDGCGILDLDVDVDALSPVGVPRDGPWTFDWSALTLNAQGEYLRPDGIDSVTIARFDDWTTSDLEGDFLNLELDASESWPWSLTGGSSLTIGADTSVDAPDFNVDGLWILALRCDTCYNPAPLFLTLLEPIDVKAL